MTAWISRSGPHVAACGLCSRTHPLSAPRQHRRARRDDQAGARRIDAAKLHRGPPLELELPGADLAVPFRLVEMYDAQPPTVPSTPVRSSASWKPSRILVAVSAALLLNRPGP